jgi:endoglucanase
MNARGISNRRIRLISGAAGLAVVALLGWLASTSSASHGQLASLASAPHASQPCYPGLNTPRDPANPLGLATAPGPDPLNGANLYVEGPGYGLAAMAIAQLVGLDPAKLSSTTWPQFQNYLATSTPAAQAQQVALLEKIAVEPETAKFTPYNRGGTPPQIFISASNYICRVPPGQVAVLTTYYLKHQADCKTDIETPADQALFKQRVDATAEAIGTHPFVLFSEFDAVGTAGCLTHAGLSERMALLKYEINAFSALPHGVIYSEAGESDSNKPAFAAKILKAEGISKIRGFFLGATHEAWTINEIKFGDKISKLTHGAHFVVSTQANGRGPLLNPHPSTQGIEVLCNPRGRGLGPQPTANTGFPLVDAFEWVTTPGRSGGNCHPGDPASGTFGVNLAEALATNANGKLGPGYPSHPY